MDIFINKEFTFRLKSIQYRITVKDIRIFVYISIKEFEISQIYNQPKSLGFN